MAVNFSAFGKELNDSYKDILAEGCPLNWAIYSYEKGCYDLKLEKKGSQGLEELWEEFDEHKIQYAFTKVVETTNALPKYVFLSWCGEGVPVSRKAVFYTHVRDVEKFFKGYHIHVSGRNYDDISPEVILKKVRDSAGVKATYQNPAPVVEVPKITETTTKALVPPQKPNVIYTSSRGPSLFTNRPAASPASLPSRSPPVDVGSSPVPAIPVAVKPPAAASYATKPTPPSTRPNFLPVEKPNAPVVAPKSLTGALANKNPFLDAQKRDEELQKKIRAQREEREKAEAEARARSSGGTPSATYTATSTPAPAPAPTYITKAPAAKNATLAAAPPNFSRPSQALSSSSSGHAHTSAATPVPAPVVYNAPAPVTVPLPAPTSAYTVSASGSASPKLNRKIAAFDPAKLASDTEEKVRKAREDRELRERESQRNLVNEGAFSDAVSIVTGLTALKERGSSHALNKNTNGSFTKLSKSSSALDLSNGSYEAAQRAKDEANRREKENTEKHERERGAREESERKNREDSERRAREESERRAKDDADRRTRDEDQRRAREEAELREKEAAEKRVQQEAERVAREESERSAREEAQQLAKEESEKTARDETQSRIKEESARIVRKETERRANEESERREKESAERRIHEESERRDREEKDRLARLYEQELKARSDREQYERETRLAHERQEREAADRHAREDANRLAQEEFGRRTQQEQKERAERDQQEREALLVKERQQREAADRHSREEAERVQREKKEDGDRAAREEIARIEHDNIRKAVLEKERAQKEQQEKEARERKAQQEQEQKRQELAQQEEARGQAKEVEQQRAAEEERHRMAEADSAAAAAAAASIVSEYVGAPVASPKARALYTWEAQEANEVTVYENEIVTDIQQLDPGWWQGTNMRGENGLFPANYVQMISEEDAAGAIVSIDEEVHDAAVPEVLQETAYDASAYETAGHDASAHQEVGQDGAEVVYSAIALYDYVAGEENELTFAAGDQIVHVTFTSDEWWHGYFGDKWGLFPANYVQLDQ